MIASTRKITPSSDAKQKAVTLLPALNGTTAGKGPMSVLEKDKKKAEVGSGGTNVWLIVGISLSILFVLIAVACAIYKFRSRDEGSYKIDESRNYGYEICNSKPMIHLNGKAKSGSSKSSKGVRKDLEWYVWIGVTRGRAVLRYFWCFHVYAQRACSSSVHDMTVTDRLWERMKRCLIWTAAPCSTRLFE